MLTVCNFWFCHRTAIQSCSDIGRTGIHKTNFQYFLVHLSNLLDWVVGLKISNNLHRLLKYRRSENFHVENNLRTVGELCEYCLDSTVSSHWYGSSLATKQYAKVFIFLAPSTGHPALLFSDPLIAYCSIYTLPFIPPRPSAVCPRLRHVVSPRIFIFSSLRFHQLWNYLYMGFLCLHCLH